MLGYESNTSRIATLRESLNTDAHLSLTFFALSITSAAIATFGLLEDSTAVIIGAMIIAPLLLPIQGIAFAVLNGDFRLLRRALVTLAVGAIIAVILATLLGLLFRFLDFGTQVASRTNPTLMDLGITVCAGAIGGYAKIRKDLAASVAGTAIAVALMPPLCVVGLELSRWNVSLANGALLLFLTNVVGITLACMTAFLIGRCADFHQARNRLAAMILIVLVLFFPLAANLLQLVNESRVEAAIRTALARTVTFSGATVVVFKIDWRAAAPIVNVIVRATHAITPNQIRLVEAFVAQQTGTAYRLRVGVEQVEEIDTSTAAAEPATAQPKVIIPSEHP